MVGGPLLSFHGLLPKSPIFSILTTNSKHLKSITITFHFHGTELVQNMNGCSLNAVPISFISINRIWQLDFCSFARLSRDFLSVVFLEPESPISKILFAVIQPSKVRKIQQQGAFFSHYPERSWSLNSSRGSRTGRLLLVQRVKVSQNSWQNQESHSHMACELLIRTGPPSSN